MKYIEEEHGARYMKTAGEKPAGRYTEVCCLLDAGCLLAARMLPATCCLLLHACRLPPAAGHPLLAAWHLLHAACRLLPANCCLSLHACCVPSG